MTELYIKPAEGTLGETIIGYTFTVGNRDYARIDLADEIPLPVTYNILDIRQPDKRQSNRSRTLKIPGTASNNVLFGHIFEIGISGTFNPNKKADCYILQEYNEVFRGVFQLISVSNEDGLIWYDCAIFGGIDDLFTKVTGQFLTDLDLSDLDHEYSHTNISNSWDPDSIVGTGYAYPMIDNVGRPDPSDIWNLVDFYPAVYAKEYWDRIFAVAGKTYTSTLLNSNLFKQLIVPFNKAGYSFSQAEIIAREFKASSTSNQEKQYQTTDQSATVAFQDDSTGVDYDPSNIFNTTTYEYTVSESGFYDLLFNVAAQVRIANAGTYVSFNFHALFKIKINGVDSASMALTIPFAGGVVGANTLSVTKSGVVSLTGRFLGTGDVVTCSLTAVGIPVGWNTIADPVFLRLKTASSFKNTAINRLVEGNTISMANVIPEKVLMTDFVMGIVKMFNLYLEEDKNDPNNYIIETRDDYFLETNPLDWSKKVDLSQPIDTIPMAELQGKRYKFRYKEDQDYWNKDYQNKYKIDGVSETFGQKTLDVDNDWVTAEVITEPVFSPTQLFGSTINKRIIPQIVKDFQTDSKQQTGFNVRILYYAGLISVGNSWTFVWSGGSQSYDQYPYAGHLDHPLLPTIDLSFEHPHEVSYAIRREQYTNNNLYNAYYKRAMEEIINPEARIIAAYMLLNENDIASLSFRKLYYLEKDYFRLNKIIEYDLNEHKPVKCEFIKSIDVGVFVPTQHQVLGGDIGDPQEAPRDSIRGKMIQGVDRGLNNYIPSDVANVIVTGDNNIIGQGASNIQLLNSSNNYIEAGISNVTLINSDNLTVASSDVIYVNGCKFSGCEFAEVPSGSLDGVNTVFTLSGTPTSPSSVKVAVNGVLKLPTIDYNIGGSTITFLSAPSGTTIFAWWR